MLILEFEEMCLENFLYLIKFFLLVRDNNCLFYLVFICLKKEKMNGYCRSENVKKNIYIFFFCNF